MLAILTLALQFLLKTLSCLVNGKFGLCYSLELLIKSSRNLTIHTIRTENNTSRHSSEHLVTSKEDLQLDRITQWPITTIFNLS